MTVNIKIMTSEQAQKLNRIAERYPYEIWIHGRSGQADAKSMLGLMLLTIEDDVKLVVDDSIDTAALEEEIKEFIV
jgi:phosphotransferase system HPr-like phosphotransfer protein